MPELKLFEETLRETAGFLTNRERNVSIPLSRITEATDLIYNSIYQGKVVAPHVREFLLREALTTSDFHTCSVMYWTDRSWLLIRP